MESQRRSGLVVEHTSAQPAGCLLHRTSQTRGRKPCISRVVFSHTSSLPHNLPEFSTWLHAREARCRVLRTICGKPYMSLKTAREMSSFYHGREIRYPIRLPIPIPLL